MLVCALGSYLGERSCQRGRRSVPFGTVAGYLGPRAFSDTVSPTALREIVGGQSQPRGTSRFSEPQQWEQACFSGHRCPCSGWYWNMSLTYP